MGLFDTIKKQFQGGYSIGPDGVSRCGAGRGQACENKRYNEEMAAKNSTLQNEAMSAEFSNLTTSGSTKYIYIGAGLLVLIILIYIFKRK